MAALGHVVKWYENEKDLTHDQELQYSAILA